MENLVLMQQARESLKGNWALAIGTFVVYGLITSAVGSLEAPYSMVSLLVGGPFALGLASFSLNLSREGDARLEQIFLGFNRFPTALGAYLLMLLYITLWALLLIIPGIIAGLSYSMTFYILSDNTEIRAEEALRISKKMMDGYKLKLFYLWLRFFGLSLLCILTLGIGFLWLIPFIHVSMAKFYDDIK